MCIRILKFYGFVFADDEYYIPPSNQVVQDDNDRGRTNTHVCIYIHTYTLKISMQAIFIYMHIYTYVYTYYMAKRFYAINFHGLGTLKF